jgi:hypothetical protein
MNEQTILPARRDDFVARSALPPMPLRLSTPIRPFPRRSAKAAFSSIATMLQQPGILGVFLIVILAGVGLTLLQTPKYSATAPDDRSQSGSGGS